uniref:Uncharacterized protein n=1 Tax=Panagrolaimus sp. ES5 TaxID=591445 RepID=A0AC34GWC9_9BILA
MDLNGPVNFNLQEVVRDLDAITKEMITIAVRTDKSENDSKMLSTLARLFAKKEIEFQQLYEQYRHRLRAKIYISELEETLKNRNQHLEGYSNGFQSMYNKLAELNRRVETVTEYSKADAPLASEDIVKSSYLYSKAHSVAAPEKKAKNYRPYPTSEELQKCWLKLNKNRIPSKQPPQFPDPDYISSANPSIIENKEVLDKYRIKFASTSLGSTTSLDKYKKIKPKKEEKQKSKFWTHYRDPYESITVAPWNEKAFIPQGFIEQCSNGYNRNDEGNDGLQNGIRRPSTPEYPITNFYSMQEMHSTFYKAIIENEEQDLFANEEHLNPASVQSCDMVEGDNFEHFEKFQEITEHAKQKYYNSFNEEVIPWMQIPGKEKYKKKPNQKFRLTTHAYFGEQQRIAKRIVWNAKYNRFYRDFKYRVPKLCGRGFIFNHPHLQDDERTLNQKEYCWNLRKWTLSTAASTPNI